MSTYKITSGTGNVAIQIDNEETPTRYQVGEIRYDIDDVNHRLRIYDKDGKSKLYDIARTDVRGNTNQSFATPSLLDAYLESIFFLNGA